ncbi:MAG: radical SAM protein [Anaerolineae bacterium]|nr:radical SAM protein [Anaerolineae bacterium]
MRIQTIPSTLEKLAQIGDATDFEPAGDQPESERRGRYQSHSLAECISNVATPRGKMPVLKTMITTACERNCYYCPFRAGRGKTKRVTFTPDELASALDQMGHAGHVEGMFLSSGIIKGSVTTQDKIIDSAEIIRRKYGYRGYVHLKIMPGAEYDQVRRAMQLADRVSINLEGPTPERLSALAPKKDFYSELLERIRWAQQLRVEGVRASTVTQFVVGAVGDTDLELLSLSSQLYRQSGLTRAYYSRFNPVLDTPFENLTPTLPLREHRLYQASFLLRDYAWDVEELPFQGAGDLRLDVDPKRAWADIHLLYAPVEIMQASREQLLRIPGIGPKGADAILKARRVGRLRDLAHLRAIGIAAPERTAPYILLDGRKPPQQLPLF